MEYYFVKSVSLCSLGKRPQNFNQNESKGQKLVRKRLGVEPVVDIIKVTNLEELTQYLTEKR